MARFKAKVGWGRAPVWTGAPPSVQLDAGATFNWSPYASDPDFQPVTFSLVSPPSGYSITSGGLMTAGPASGTVVVRASDGARTADHAATVTINAPSVPLQWVIGNPYTLPSMTAGSGDEVELSAFYQKPTGVTEILALTSDSSGLLSINGTRLIRPGALTANSYSAAVNLSSSTENAGARTFNYTVNAQSGQYLRTLYVNNVTGDDSRTITQAQNPSTPWRTIHRAVKGSATAGQTNAGQAATAGDLVLVAATGSPYWEVGVSGATARFSVVLTPVNNGTSANPICIRGSGGRPEIRAANAGFRGPMIGASGRSYIIWDSVKIDDTYCASTSDTGPAFFGEGASHCQLVNSEIQGHNGSYYWGHSTFAGNYRVVGMSSAQYCRIANNKISRVYEYSGPGSQNEGAILAYSARNCVIENNTIWDAGSGIWFKGIDGIYDQRENIVRFNLIYNCAGGIRLTDLGSVGDNRIYQNVIRNAAGGAGVALHAGQFSARSSKWFNNTIVGCPRGAQVHSTEVVDNRFYNNIFASNVGAQYNFSQPPADKDAWYDRNLYWGNNFIYQSEGGGNQTALSGWQSLSATKCDPNGLSANPLFVNAAANDFRLQAGSPALTLGRDVYGTFGAVNAVIPAGAYITGNEQIGANW